MTEDYVYGNANGRQDEVSVVTAIYEAFERRDVEAALRFLAEDVVMLPSGTNARLNRTEPYHGHEGVREYFADAARVWSELTLHADDIRSAAGGVIVFGRAVGLADDGPMEQRVMWTWQVRDGRAVSMRVSLL